MTEFGIVVVTYNREHLLRECIDMIERQEVDVKKVIIVDNNSTDGTRSYIQTLDKEKFDCVLLDKNYGASVGFSVGIKEICKYEVDWILIIDDDAMMCPDYLSLIRSEIDKTDQTMAFSGTVMENGQISLNHRRIITNRCILKSEAVKNDEYRKDTFQYDLSTFCGLVFCKKLVDVIGYPREDFYTQYTDTEYCMRMMKYTRITNVNRATLNHKVNNVFLKDNHLGYKSYYFIRNHIFIVVQYSRMPYRLIARPVIFCECVGRVLKRMIIALFDSKNMNKYLFDCRLIMDACIDGLCGKLGKNAGYVPSY